MSADALALLTGRRSVSTRLMDGAGEAPGPADMDAIITAANRAPDHGGLVPWRFLLVTGEARTAFGEVLARARAARDPAAGEADIARERAKPLRAPLLMVAAAVVDHDHPVVRPIEQVLAAAAATTLAITAAQALGWGAIWLTGSNGHDPAVKAALGLRAQDEIVGFVYVGRPREEPPERPRPDIGAVARVWTGGIA